MEIIAAKREKFGKQTKSLRRDRQIPAVVYGEKIESTPLTIDTHGFIKVFREVGETGLIDLKFNDTSEKVLVKEVQVHPVTLAPIHVSFHQVNLTEKIRANIPVEIIGEEESPIVKSGIGLALVLLSEIEVEALPTDLPQRFVVDVSKMDTMDQAVTVAELEFNKEKVEVVGQELEDLVVKIDYATQPEEEEEEEEISEEDLIAGVEATAEKEVEEGEEGAEGSEKPKEPEKSEKSEK